MAPPGTAQTLLSPAELSFLHSSLALTPPIRPDLRTPTQFRPLVAETDILTSTNGSARICFSDGTEAIAGVKVEVEKSSQHSRIIDPTRQEEDIVMQEDIKSVNNDDGELETKSSERLGADASTGTVSDSWLEVSIEIPGFRDDDNLPVFLGAMLTETLLASETLKQKLWINQRWHWKLYIDILLLSPPLSYPLPLLSLTTHLALLDCALPRLISEPSDDPLFDDDWAAAVPMYPRSSSPNAPNQFLSRPPITLLVMTVADNIIFDPSKEELAVAESVLAVSVIPVPTSTKDNNPTIKLLAIRTIDPPSRLTPLGIPNSINPATGGDPSALGSSTPVKSGVHASATQPGSAAAAQEALVEKEKGNLWSPPRGGIKRSLISRVVKMVVGDGGVAEEVLAGLAGVEV